MHKHSLAGWSNHRRAGRSGTAWCLSLLSAVALLVVSAACGSDDEGAPSLDAPAETAEELVNTYISLLAGNDVEGLEEFISDAFTIQRADGSTATKDAYLANIPEIGEFEITEVSAGQSGDALVTRWFLEVDEVIDRETWASTPAPRLSTFAWEGDGWKLLSHANFNAPEGDAAAGDPQGAGDTPLRVELGVVQSQVGAGAAYGQPAARGIELAVDEINAAGNLAITLDVLDDQSTVEGGQAAFTTLVDNGVTAIIGPTLTNGAVEAQTIAQENGVPVVSATTTGQGITDTGDYIFRVALTEEIVVPATIEFVSGQQPLDGIVLFLDSNDAFSRSSADAMRAGIAAVGGTVTNEIDLASAGDLSAALAELDGGAIDAFLVTPLVDESATILAALRDAGFEQTVIGGNSLNTLEIAELSGGAVEDAYVGAAWNPGVSAPGAQEFVEAYTSAYGSTPDQFAAQGYASVYILIDAITRAGGTDAGDLRDALAATTDLDTILGTLSMSEGRDALHAPVVQQYEDGRLVVVG
ncbi:MAG: ABC transporter substrate-binding protein [Dehalococcoidia bacterium]|nr:ABC transporter substrate-binding protein [Dehalococcoidia bacterium]